MASGHKKQLHPIAEILIVVAVAVVTLAICIAALVRFLQERKELLPDSFEAAETAFQEKGTDAIGTEFLPEDGVLTYDPVTGKLALYQTSEVVVLDGSVSNGRFFVRLMTSDGERLLAAYSETLEEDYKQLQMLPVTARPTFQTKGVERDFIHYLMAVSYGDSCFLSGDSAWVYTTEGRERTEHFSSFTKVFVCDALTDEAVALLKKFSSLKQVEFSDLGGFALLGNVLYKERGGVLIYALPFVTKVVCPDCTYGLEKGCFQNAELTEISLPYTGKSISYLFDGRIPESLKKITFTSSLLGEIPIEATEDCEGVLVVYDF